jgi:hypothetical protein
MFMKKQDINMAYGNVLYKILVTYLDGSPLHSA